MMRPILFLLLVLGSAPLVAQTLVVSPSLEVPDLPEFNTVFIARNGITSITGVRMLKRDGEPMREESERHAYRFDTQGRTIYGNHSYGRPGSGRDTVSKVWQSTGKARQTQKLHKWCGATVRLYPEHDADASRGARDLPPHCTTGGYGSRRDTPDASRTGVTSNTHTTMNDTTCRRKHWQQLRPRPALPPSRPSPRTIAVTC